MFIVLKTRQNFFKRYNRPYDGYSLSVDATISKIIKKINDKDKVTYTHKSTKWLLLKQRSKKVRLTK
ncbi:hypothetical protein [Francisella persica]|uniref:hypothetical protein n=1 Tax=Francisella persica TaxID=954 RepID=UPI000A8AF1A1|nr:hypothetical protein [Francisella persica]